MNPGATGEEWKFFKKLAAEDLLPVVSNLNAPIASYSTMKALGKTPSQYNDRGEAIGIGKWTQRTAHLEEIKSWSKEKDYGICIQTRRIRALDIDVDDPEEARNIAFFIQEWINAKPPLRWREGSGKCLVAFTLEGEFGKRTVKTKGGMIEFLANGQQFVAAGTHTSGKRYQWYENDWTVTLNEDEFEDLWFALCEEFGTEAPTQRGLRKYEETITEDLDDTGRYLVDKGLAHGSGNAGQLFIDCPFADGHSTESNGTDTAYFSAGTGGYDQGHFVCLHASCGKRTDQDFMKALGVYESEYEVVQVEEEKKEKELPAWARDKHGQPQATLYNLRLALERQDICKYTPRYDTFRDEVLFCDEHGNWFPESDELPIEIRMRLETIYSFREISKEKMKDSIWWVARRNKVDTAQEWLDSLEWDGVARIEKFLPNYMGCEDTPYTRAVSLYLWTGLAGRVIEPGLKADMIPVVQSPEGYRKSTAIAAIPPTPEQFVELHFGEKDADLARMMRGALIGEIAELRGLRTRELEGILAWCSRRFEKWIPKFKEYSSTFPRRLMFIATTNEEEFLDGTRIHRRWLPVEAKNKADVTALERDRNQLWAEAREVFKRDGLHYEEADRLAPHHREQYRIKDVWEDVIREWLVTMDSLDDTKPEDREFITLLDVARFALNLDLKNLKRLDEKKIVDCLKALGYAPVRRYVDGVQTRVWKKKNADLV